MRLVSEDPINGVDAAVSYILDGKPEEAVVTAVAARIIPEGDFTITPPVPMTPFGPLYSVFEAVTESVGMLIAVNGQAVEVKSMRPSDQKLQAAYLASTQSGNEDAFWFAQSLATRQFEPVWHRFVWLLQRYLIWDTGVDWRQTEHRLNLAGEGIPDDGVAVLQPDHWWL